MLEGCDAAICALMWKKYVIAYGCRSMMIVRMLLLWMENVVVEKCERCCEEVVEVRF